MITLKFFGKLGDIAGESMTLPADDIATLADVIAVIATQQPALFDAISAPQVMSAVNQQIVSRDASVSSGDEVAFLPPVTGG